MNEQTMNRMRELVSLLNRASEAYYAQDTEIMSNYEYDRLYDELAALEDDGVRSKTEERELRKIRAAAERFRGELARVMK